MTLGVSAPSLADAEAQAAMYLNSTTAQAAIISALQASLVQATVEQSSLLPPPPPVAQVASLEVLSANPVALPNGNFSLPLELLVGIRVAGNLSGLPMAASSARRRLLLNADSLEVLISGIEWHGGNINGQRLL